MKRWTDIKITHIYYVIAAALLITTVVIIVSMQQSAAAMRRLQEKTEEYIEVQEAISDMKEASDYLTEECRAYVITGDIGHVGNYYHEIISVKRRDNAVETIKEYNNSEAICTFLENALKGSNELCEVEEYAMRLAAYAHNDRDPMVKKLFKGIEISDEDYSMDKSEQLAKATSMIFDKNYENKKNEIMKNVFDSLDKLIDDTKSEQLELYRESVKISNREHALFFLMIFLTLSALFATLVLVIMPLNRSIGFIRHNEMLPVNGSHEYNFLAVTFNRMLEKNRKNSEILSYEATHDALTGLYNRKMFENTRIRLADSDNALIIFDIDHFKEINDTYGHEVGDLVLKKVADVLMGSFRNEDYVCRIGGDEFVVIMVQMKPEIGHVVSRKIEQVRSRLSADSGDGLPAATLSIGAAFSADSQQPEDLFRNADEALYNVKRKGRNGFAFYKELPAAPEEGETEN